MTRQLRYILAAAREGSIAAAAEAESISASSVLSAIGKFEDQYGVQLFVRRRSKGLITTSSGRRILMRMHQLLEDVEAFESDLGRKDAGLSGELRLGAFAPISAHVVPHILKSMKEEHPDLRIICDIENSLRDVEASLRAGTVDVALTYDAFISNDLEAKRIIDVPPYALLAANDRLADQDVVTIGELAQRPIILIDAPDSAQYILSLFTASGHRPDITLRTTSYELIRSSVALGVGASVLNIRPMVDVTYSGERVVCRPLELESKTLDSCVAVVTRKGGAKGQRVQTFIDHCKRFAQSPAAEKLKVKAPQELRWLDH